MFSLSWRLNWEITYVCSKLYHNIWFFIFIFIGTQYLIYIKQSQQSIMQKTKFRATWTPPHNSYKINVEGAVFAAHKSAGVGILIRDEGGRLVGACSKKLLAPLGAVQAEAKAIELGLSLQKICSSKSSCFYLIL